MAAGKSLEREVCRRMAATLSGEGYVDDTLQPMREIYSN
jgi:hypothetical protein